MNDKPKGNTGLRAAVMNAPTAPEATPYELVKVRLQDSRKDFKALLGSDDAVAKFERVALNAIVESPDLLEANRNSLLMACMRAAKDGLMPDGQQSVLLAFNVNVGNRDAPKWIKKVTYIPMVRGLLDILWDTKEFSYIDAAVVYEKDRFTFKRGLNLVLEHEPFLGGERGEIVAAYFVARMKGSDYPKVEVMGREDIEKIRSKSRAPDKAWADWFDQFAIKSVIKRACKQLPRINRLERAIEADNEFVDVDFGRKPEAIELPVIPQLGQDDTPPEPPAAA